jgi:hypothetical protein
LRTGRKKAGTAAVDPKISFGRSCETVGISDRCGRTLSGSRCVCVSVQAGGTSGSTDGSDGLRGSGSVQQNSGKQNGENGYLVSADQPEEYIQAIEKLLRIWKNTEEVRQMRKNNRARIKQYSLQTVLKKYRKIVLALEED